MRHLRTISKIVFTSMSQNFLFTGAFISGAQEKSAKLLFARAV